MLLASVCTLSLGCSATSPTPVAVSSREPSQDRATVAPRGVGQPALVSPQKATLRYVALGDSYTYGQSVKPRDRWPNQLVRMLGPGSGLNLVANLAYTGATTSDVMTDELNQMTTYRPNFVSLLIGVNDIVRGISIDVYRHNLRTITRSLLAVVPPNRLLMVTIPDYTLTPAGPTYAVPNASAKVKAFNEVMQEEAQSLGITCVDIAPAADQVATNRSLVADDGLHPSARQYAAWVELIAPSVRLLLSQPEASGGTQ